MPLVGHWVARANALALLHHNQARARKSMAGADSPLLLLQCGDNTEKPVRSPHVQSRWMHDRYRNVHYIHMDDADASTHM